MDHRRGDYAYPLTIVYTCVQYGHEGFALDADATEVSIMSALIDSAALPVLTGSDKQIAWAESIRAAIVRDANVLMDKAWTAAAAAGHDPAAVIAPQAATIAAAIASQPAASWWIDNRDATLRSAVAKLQGR